MSGSGQEAIPEGREWSGGQTEGPGVVGNGWESIPDGRE